MLDFFNALSDLLESDLIKGNISVIVIALIIIIVLVCFVTWIFCTKVFLQIKLNQVAAKEQEFSEMKTKIQELENKNYELTEQLKKYNFEKALDYKATTAFEDSALEQFKRREK
jgi:cell division protein FtsB